MPAVYDKLGVKFDYPENWRVREEEVVEWPRSLVVESPGGAFWSLHIYPDQQQDRQMRAEEAMQALASEYDTLEQTAASEMWGEVVAEGYDLSFYCLDFVVAGRIRCFHAHGRTYLTLSQAEDRDFQELSQVFLALTFSLLRHQPRAD